MAPTESTSNAGIQTSSSGERVIPASVRADGTVRKEIRVKPGYRPPEDVELYKNRTAESWKNRGRGGIPGAESVQSTAKESGASTKNAKRREARRKAGLNGQDDGAESVPAPANDAPGNDPRLADEPQVEVDPEVEAAKEARKLAKKLRQAKELKEKKDLGDGLLPEQLAKVIKIQELVRQLDKLGFDSNGEKKTMSDEQP